MSEPELLTFDEMYEMCQLENPEEDFTTIAQAQRAKDEAYYESEIERQKELVCQHYNAVIAKIETLTIPARIAEAEKELIKWLDDPCTEHVLSLQELGRCSCAMCRQKWESDPDRFISHRRDCFKCWQSIKEGR